MKIWITTVLDAIDEFNRAGQNPYGELQPIEGHAPLTFELRTGEPPDLSGRWPEYPSLEFPFHPKDRDAETDSEVRRLYFETNRTHLFPMTKAYIKRGWHRVYRFDVSSGKIEAVRLLATAKQEPAIAGRSAHDWLMPDEELGLIAPDGFLVSDP